MLKSPIIEIQLFIYISYILDMLTRVLLFITVCHLDQLVAPITIQDLRLDVANEQMICNKINGKIYSIHSGIQK